MVMGKLDSLMQKNGTGSTDKKKKNSKWVTELHVIPEIIELLEENIEKKPFDNGLGSDFF